jgi:hypothetical protein
MTTVKMKDIMRRRSVTAILVAPLLVAGLIFLSACSEGDFRPDAVGAEGEIFVVMDTTLWRGPAGDAVRNEIGTYIPTLPAPEASFDLRQISLDSRSLDRIRASKNIVFVAPLTDTSNVARFIRSRLPEGGADIISAGGQVVASRPDLWRRNQRVFFIAAADTADLIRTLSQHGPAIRDTFNLVTRQRLTREMFRRGRQPDLENHLMEEHGFSVNIQHDYVIATDTTDFVWLRRTLSDTWRSLFVHYIEGADPGIITPQWIAATRDSLTREYIQGNLGGWVEIDRRMPVESEEVDFRGRYGQELRGVWQMVGRDETGNRFQFGMAGAFVTYAFYDQYTDRVYLIDGMIFAPNYDKREFLRQMEVIAYTFRTNEAGGSDRAVASR